MLEVKSSRSPRYFFPGNVTAQYLHFQCVEMKNYRKDLILPILEGTCEPVGELFTLSSCKYFYHQKVGD